MTPRTCGTRSGPGHRDKRTEVARAWGTERNGEWFAMGTEPGFEMTSAVLKTEAVMAT